MYQVPEFKLRRAVILDANAKHILDGIFSSSDTVLVSSLNIVIFECSVPNLCVPKANVIFTMGFYK